MDITLAKTLARWARNDETKTAQIEDWLDAAISAIAEGKGASPASVTANGVSVNMSAGSLTVAAWANTLSYTLTLISTPAVSRIRGSII